MNVSRQGAKPPRSTSQPNNFFRPMFPSVFPWSISCHFLSSIYVSPYSTSHRGRFSSSARTASASRRDSFSSHTDFLQHNRSHRSRSCKSAYVELSSPHDQYVVVCILDAQRWQIVVFKSKFFGLFVSPCRPDTYDTCEQMPTPVGSRSRQGLSIITARPQSNATQSEISPRQRKDGSARCPRATWFVKTARPKLLRRWLRQVKTPTSKAIRSQSTSPTQ